MDNICTYAESIFESYIKKIIRRIDENEKITIIMPVFNKENIYGKQ